LPLLPLAFGGKPPDFPPAQNGSDPCEQFA
jgi:hypothetical protein